MDDHKSKIFFNRLELNVFTLLGAMFFGGIVIFFGYLFRRYARYCDELDSIKDIKDGDKKVGVDPRSTFADKTASLVIGKRIKHKKRREVMQEFSHTWVAGALKGHTGTIFNMNLSSNGKQLASCGEDGKLPKGMESMGGVATATSTTATVPTTAKTGVAAAVATATTSTTTSTTVPSTVPSTSSTIKTTTKTTITSSSSSSSTSFTNSFNGNRNKYLPSDRRYSNDRNDYLNEYRNNQMNKTMKEHYTPRPSFLWSNENDQTVSNWTSPQLVNNKNQYQQFYIPEYNPNQNLCNLNHYQQEARNVYFQQLYMQIITIQQMFGNSLITSQQNNWQNPNYYYQKLPQLREQIIDVGINYHTTLFVNGISPYWMEGREPSKKTHGFVLTKRDEFIINDTIFEYVLRTYVHHPLYLIEAGYPCIWIFDARFQQFVNNLHIPFGYAMIGGYSSGGGNNGGQLATFVNKSNKMSTYKEENFKNNNEQQKRKQTRDLVRSSSFSSSSRRTFIDDTTTMTRQRSSTISTVSELNTFEIRCSMCLKGFYLYRANGDLNKQEVCVHHPGELIFNNKSKVKTWTCCNNRASVLGCKTYTTHLWKNFKKNFANSQIDFVRTKPSEIQSANHIYGIYGIDCEMVTTKAGLELAKVSLVNIHGYIVYNEYVIPGSEVIDYNTRFSGITPEILSNATKTLSMVQQDLLEYIKAETILIGHALENDLKVLRILHYTCIDTALLFKHPDELPFRHSLRALSKRYLQKIIQAGSHDSVEDTTAAINLVLFKLRDDGF